MGGGRIDCYLDISSFFSYVAFVDLLNNFDKLAANGVEVEFHPVFLGGIMQSTGNAPPWTVKAKGAYLARAAGVAPGWALPRDLVALTQTTPALRALLFVKAHHPARVLHAALLALFGAFWTSPHARLADDDALAAALVAALVASGALADNEVRRALAGRADFKDALAAETRRAAELGAFGAPCRLTRPVGTFGQIYERLGVAHRSVEVLEPPARL